MVKSGFLYVLLVSLLLPLTSNKVFAQLLIDNTSINAEDLVNDIFSGSGVTISNVTFNGSGAVAQSPNVQIGRFSNGGSTGLGLSEGVLLGTGNVQLATDIDGPSSNNTGIAPDIIFDGDIEALTGSVIHNAAVLEFDFVPRGNVVSFRYVFASNEYSEFVCSNWNDAFGFFLSGPGISGSFINNAENIALIPGSSDVVAINSVNNGTTGPYDCSALGCPCNDGFFQDNFPNTNGHSYNGYTSVLTASYDVQCGETYHIKIAIADAGDIFFDSGVFLEASSFQSGGTGAEITLLDAQGQPIENDTIVQGCNSAELLFTKPQSLSGSSYDIDITLSGDGVPGTHYNDISGVHTIDAGSNSTTVVINPTPGEVLPGGFVEVIVTAEVTNECGEVVQTSFTFYIKEPPTFNVIVSDTIINCPDLTPEVTLGYTLSGGQSPFTQEWSPGGETTETITVPTTAPGLITYTVEVTDACGVVVQEDIDVTVNVPPVMTIDLNSDVLTVCDPGLTAIAEVVNVNNPQGPVTYTWYNVSDVVVSNDPDITISLPTGQTQTIFYVDVTDGCQTVRDTVELNLAETIEITDISTLPSSFCADNDGDGQISVTTDPSVGMTYTLVGAGNNYGPQANGDFSFLIGGVNYTLTVTDASGCQIQQVIPVGLSVPPANIPAFDIPVDIVSHVSCYQANDGEVNIENIRGGFNGPNPPYKLVWQNSNGNSFDILGIITEGADHNENSLEGGVWTVTVFDASGCAFSNTFTVNEPEELTITLVNINEPSCYKGDDGSINTATRGGTGIKSWTWTDTQTGEVIQTGFTQQITDVPTGEYTITAEDENGCTTSETFFVDHPDSIQFDIRIDSIVCYGRNTGAVIIESVNVNNLDDYDYTLNPGGMKFDSAYSFIDLPSGEYALAVLDQTGNNCPIANIPILIKEPPTFIWEQLGSIPSDCFPGDNGNGQVFVEVSGGWNGTYYVSWSSEGGGYSSSPTWGNRPPGEYNLTLTEEETGCRWDTVVVVEPINPIAIIDADPLYGPTPLNVTVDNNSQNSVQYAWYVNGQLITLTNDIDFGLDTTFLTSDTVTYCLVAFNQTGCTDTACQAVIVIPSMEIIYPNVFSPDGDGINDQYFFPYEGVNTFYCVIFDRWGKKVYEWDDVDAGWDGRRLNGKDVPDGVYFYMVEATGLDGTDIQEQGNIHVKRNK